MSRTHIQLSQVTTQVPNFWNLILFNAAIFILCVISNIDLFLYLLFFVAESCFGFIGIYLYGIYTESKKVKLSLVFEYLFGLMFILAWFVFFGYILVKTGHVLEYGNDESISYDLLLIGKTILLALGFVLLQAITTYVMESRKSEQALGIKTFFESFSVTYISLFLLVFTAAIYWLIVGFPLVYSTEFVCSLFSNSEIYCKNLLPKFVVLCIFLVLKVYMQIHIFLKENKTGEKE